MTVSSFSQMDLLGQMGDCPICLDPMDPHTRPATTLPCCHKVCQECWHNWQLLRPGRAECPLCRQHAFLQTLFERQDP